jgi:hypothetical protein
MRSSAVPAVRLVAPIYEGLGFARSPLASRPLFSLAEFRHGVTRGATPCRSPIILSPTCRCRPITCPKLQRTYVPQRSVASQIIAQQSGCYLIRYGAISKCQLPALRRFSDFVMCAPFVERGRELTKSRERKTLFRLLLACRSKSARDLES